MIAPAHASSLDFRYPLYDDCPFRQTVDRAPSKHGRAHLKAASEKRTSLLFGKMKGLNVMAVLLSSLSLANAWGVVGKHQLCPVAHMLKVSQAMKQ